MFCLSEELDMYVMNLIYTFLLCLQQELCALKSGKNPLLTVMCIHPRPCVVSDFGLV